jgi:hypothetical protein
MIMRRFLMGLWAQAWSKMNLLGGIRSCGYDPKADIFSQAKESQTCRSPEWKPVSA